MNGRGMRLRMRAGVDVRGMLTVGVGMRLRGYVLVVEPKKVGSRVVEVLKGSRGTERCTRVRAEGGKCASGERKREKGNPVTSG